jgi:glycine C-acetyltransferase
LQWQPSENGAECGKSKSVELIVGDTAFAVRMSQALPNEDIFIAGCAYPVVPDGTARLRIQACATLSDDQIDFALKTIENVGNALGVV